MPLLIFFPFIFDATVTLALRAIRGSRLTRAHREHLYQRCALSGMNHRTLGVRAYLIMATCSMAAHLIPILTLWAQIALLTMVLALHIVMILSVERYLAKTDGARLAAANKTDR